MGELRAIVTSDTHLSPRAPEAMANWDAVVAHVDRTRPDLVLHVGDLTLDGMSDARELDRARALLDRLSVPWYAVPGNHDVGDNPGNGHANDGTITPERRQSWLDSIGPDRWAINRVGWTLLALNTQLFGSGLTAEAAQWDWLDDQLESMPAGQPTVLLMHKPLSAPDAELATAPPYRFVPQPARQRLERWLDHRAAPLVVSGHVHQFRILEAGARRDVWVPTTWAVLPDRIQAPVGAKRCGVVSLTLTDDGRTRASMFEPAGIDQITLTEDIPDPYDR
ncbi:MAG: metallophosphoesterase family protein [Acidimicrobiales bacterium]